MNENLNKAGDILTDVVMHVVDSLKDGKITGAEAIGLLPKLMDIPTVVENKELLANEWKGRTPESVISLADYVSSKLSFTNVDTAKKAKSLVYVLAAAVNAMDAFKSTPALPEEQVA